VARRRGGKKKRETDVPVGERAIPIPDHPGKTIPEVVLQRILGQLGLITISGFEPGALEAEELSLGEYLDLCERNRVIIRRLLEMGEVVAAWDVASMFFWTAFCDDVTTKEGVEITEKIVEGGTSKDELF